MSEQDEQLMEMMNQFGDQPAAETTTENVAEESPAVESNEQAADEASVPQTSEGSESDATPANIMTDENSVPVSTVILENSDKYLHTVLANPSIVSLSEGTDLTNYIVYINTTKKIPCIYDCVGLRLPKASVQNADGSWNITSIEGRRSGFVIKCPNRDLVMTKNFVYDCTLDANGNITSVYNYNRRKTMTLIDMPQPVTNFEDASLLVRAVLPKIVKSGKYTTVDLLKEQVKLAYDKVDDINGLFKIVTLRTQLGC